VTQPLLARVRAFNRRVYSSLPWGFRVAQVLIKLSSSLTETVGRVFYAIFLDAGVEGMPPGPEPGTPAGKLPRDYGRRFGERLYAFLLQKAKNATTVEDVLSEMMVTASRDKFDLKPGTSLRGAEQYVMRAAQNHLINHIRKDKTNKRLYDFEVDDEGGFDMADPDAFRHLDNFLPRSELQQLMRELEGVHARAPSWLEAQLEGLKNVELAEEWGVTKPAVTMWEQKYVPQIKNVVMKYLKAAA